MDKRVHFEMKQRNNLKAKKHLNNQLFQQNSKKNEKKDSNTYP